MNHQSINAYLVVIVLACFLVIPLLSIMATAYEDSAPYSGSKELWNVLEEFSQSKDLYDSLMEDGWIDNDVRFDEFDYILVLSNQLCSMSGTVDLPLVMSMIAYESRFNSEAVSSVGARGLMQLMTIFHSKRMEQFVEVDHQIDLDVFFDPRLNIATGIDYLEECLECSNGNLEYALMIYNQGPSSAKRDYTNGYISNYARDIIDLSNTIRECLRII